jgi:hypothetical protein
MIERMKMMKEALMNCVQGQLGDLSSVDAKELGEAVDMIKDFSEAIYYCTITESMKKGEEEGKYKYYPAPMYENDHYYYGGDRDMDKRYGRMYYDGGMPGGTSKNYPIELRDSREGHSPVARKTYMERKMHGEPKEVQMQELEKYMHELSNDITEMIEGASPEEKQMLQRKISALATKIV